MKNRNFYCISGRFRVQRFQKWHKNFSVKFRFLVSHFFFFSRPIFTFQIFFFFCSIFYPPGFFCFFFVFFTAAKACTPQPKTGARMHVCTILRLGGWLGGSPGLFLSLPPDPPPSLKHLSGIHNAHIHTYSRLGAVITGAEPDVLRATIGQVHMCKYIV